MTSRDRRAIRAYVLRINARRFWDSLGPWEQIMVAGVLWTGLWIAVVHAAYPYLLRAVSA